MVLVIVLGVTNTIVAMIYHKVTWQEDEQEMQEDCISEEHKNEVEQKLTTKNIVPFKLD